MMYKKNFYSVVLTSIVCVLGVMSGTFASVRNLGTSGNTTSGTSSDTKASASSNSGASVSSGQSLRASSLRFSPGTINTSGTATKSLNDNNSGTDGAVVGGNASSARLSIGKYLNLSHSNKQSQNQGTSQGGNTVIVNPGDEWNIQIDRMSTRIDNIDIQKQNKLIVNEGDYINITGPDENIISIDIDALQTDIQQVVGTDKEILTELDSNYKLWWCYANEDKTECVGERQEVIDLGTLLRDYNLVEKNISLKEALAGKQGILSEAENGYIEVNQEQGTVGVRFAQLRDALGISNSRQSEIQYTADGKLQWRYIDEYESDGVTKKWNTADIQALIDSSLANYVTSEIFNTYVLNAEHSDLEADPNGYLQINNDKQIGIKFNELKTALNIPEEREVEIEFADDGKIKWRYVGDSNWHQTTKKVGDFINLSGLQGALSVDQNGFLQINNNVIGIKFNELKTALNIPDAQQDIEMQITSNGQLQWRYLNEYESDGTTKKWTTVSMSIGDLIENKLVGYQKILTTNENGYLAIDGNTINLKFVELKRALGIPEGQQDIEMEITSDGNLRWRYVNQFESDGTTKAWTTVSMSIGDLIDNKLNGYQKIMSTDENGYLAIEGDTINLKFVELKKALNIPDAQQDIEMQITTSGDLQWRYANQFESDGTTKAWTTVSISISDLIDDKLNGYQRTLTTDENGYLAIDGDTINLKFVELKRALNIPDAQQDIEMEITDGGVLRWRYVNQFESDGTTKSWTNVSSSINDLIDNKLLILNNYQKILSADQNGFLKIDNNVISIKFAELKAALGIPEAQEKIEMEITDAGVLRWRYLNEFESDGTTKKWTVVSESIGDLIDGKLADYATKQYVDNGLATKQVKLTEAENGFINVTTDGVIGVRFDDLKTALGIVNHRPLEMQVDNGVLKWRYTDTTGEPEWTIVYDFKSLLDDYVKTSDFNLVINRIDKDLAGKQIKLTATPGGFILLTETGEISVDMESLRNYLVIEGNDARTSELRVKGGELQWRYLDELTKDDNGNLTEIWHTLDLSTIELPYVTRSYLVNNYYNKNDINNNFYNKTEMHTNYYNKTDIDSLAQSIENNINIRLERWALDKDGPTDNGLFLLSVTDGADDNKVSTWHSVQIAGAEDAE